MPENINVRSGSGATRAGDSDSAPRGPDDGAQLSRMREKLKSAGVQREFSDDELRAIKRRGQERLQRQDTARETHAENEASRGKDVGRSVRAESREARLADTTGAERARGAKKLDPKTERSIRSDPNATPIPGNPPEADPADAQQARKLLSALLGNILIGDEPLDIEAYAKTLRKVPPTQPRSEEGPQSEGDAARQGNTGRQGNARNAPRQQAQAQRGQQQQGQQPGPQGQQPGRQGRRTADPRRNPANLAANLRGGGGGNALGPMTLPKPGAAAQARAAALMDGGAEGEGNAELPPNGQRPGQSPGQTGRRTAANTRRTPNAMSLLEATRSSTNPANAGIGARSATPTRGANLGGTPTQGNGQLGNSTPVSFNAGGSFTSGSVDMGRLARTNLEGFYAVFIIRNAKMAHIWMKALRELRKWEGKFELASHELQIKLLEMRQQFERMNRLSAAMQSISNVGEAGDQAKASKSLGQDAQVARQNSQDMLENLEGIRSLSTRLPGTPGGQAALRNAGIRPQQKVLTPSQLQELQRLATAEDSPLTPEQRQDLQTYLEGYEGARAAFVKNAGLAGYEGLMRWQLADIRSAASEAQQLPQLITNSNSAARQLAQDLGIEGPAEGSTELFEFSPEAVAQIQQKAATDPDFRAVYMRYFAANKNAVHLQNSVPHPKAEEELVSMIRENLAEQDAFIAANGSEGVFAKANETYRRLENDVGVAEREYTAQSDRFMRAMGMEGHLPPAYRRWQFDGSLNNTQRQELQALIEADDNRHQAHAARNAYGDFLARNQPLEGEARTLNEENIRTLLGNAETARRKVQDAYTNLFPETADYRLGQYRPQSEIDPEAMKAFTDAVKEVRTHMVALSYQLSQSGGALDNGVAVPEGMDLGDANPGNMPLPPEVEQRLNQLNYYTDETRTRIDPQKFLEARGQLAEVMMGGAIRSAGDYISDVSGKLQSGEIPEAENAAAVENVRQAREFQGSLEEMRNFKNRYMNPDRWPGNYALEAPQANDPKAHVDPLLHFRNSTESSDRTSGAQEKGRSGGTMRAVNKTLEAISGGLGSAFEDGQFIASVDRAVMGARMGARRSRARSDAMLREAIGKSQGMLNQLVQIQAMSRQV